MNMWAQAVMIRCQQEKCDYNSIESDCVFDFLFKFILLERFIYVLNVTGSPAM